ncbi:flavin reductase family protein [Massilia sp. erpn]|nr:flavin reductase family protein [Massilia sp. erpn]
MNMLKASSAQDREGEAFRRAMRELAGGVSVVATGAGQDRTGCTVTSFCSLSVDPPSVLVCLNHGSSTLKAMRANGAFGVSQLSANHHEVAKVFSDAKLYGAARFEWGDWRNLITGSPLLSDALAVIDCQLEDVIERHTHAIIIGRVVAVGNHEQDAALVHWRGRFETLGASRV